jgi:hypothetical protein
MHDMSKWKVCDYDETMCNAEKCSDDSRYRCRSSIKKMKSENEIESLRSTISTLQSELEAMTGAFCSMVERVDQGADRVDYEEWLLHDQARAIREREGWDE